jgi:hypothetical protein
MSVAVSPMCRAMASVYCGARVGPDAENLTDLAKREACSVDSDYSADPFLLMARASKGEAAAQVLLAEMAMMRVAAGEEANPLDTMRDGIMLGRLAALQTADARMLMVAMLSTASELASEAEGAEEYAAEAIAWVEIVSEGGDELADKMSQGLTQFGDKERPALLELAKDYYARIRAALEIQ